MKKEGLESKMGFLSWLPSRYLQEEKKKKKANIFRSKKRRNKMAVDMAETFTLFLRGGEKGGKEVCPEEEENRKKKSLPFCAGRREEKTRLMVSH